MDKVDLEHFPVSAAAQKLMSYVTSGWYDNAYVGKWMFQTEGIALDAIQNCYDDYAAQLFVQTATWGLRYHEIKYGLPVREDLAYEERRRRILERNIERLPPTPYVIEQLIRSKLPEFDISVADINDTEKALEPLPHPNVFAVILHGDMTPNVAYLKLILDGCKQSHTMYLLYEYLIMQWEVPILYETCMRFQVDFSAQRSVLVFNGLWKFDGKETFRGWHGIEDYYPMQLTMQTDVEMKVHAESGIRVEHDLWYFNGTHRFDGKMKFDAYVKEYADSGL